MQYDRPETPDSCSTFGRVQVKVETESHPEITLSLSKDPATLLLLPRYHQSVTTIADSPSGMQVTFTPPIGPTSLVKYSLDTGAIPIRGFYQMKEMASNQRKILLQLKVADPAANQFEFLIVELPFPGQPDIVGIDIQPTVGTISVDPKRKHTLVWNVGTKISGKNLEASLSGLVFFEDTPSAAVSEDPFCSKSTGYAKISFRIPDFCLSGLAAGSGSVSLNPKPNVKKSVGFSRSIESGEYIIWNSLGAAKFALSPEAPPGAAALAQDAH